MGERKKMKNIGKILALARNGDQESAEILYSHLYVPLFRYALKRVRRKEDAEDITQTVFMKLLNTQDMAADITIAYIYRSVKNATIDHWRKEGRGMVYSDEIVTELADKTPAPQEEDVGKNTQSLLSYLGEEQREAIELKYLQDLSTQEIAQVMQKSEDAVRQILSRAIRKLREKITEDNF